MEHNLTNDEIELYNNIIDHYNDLHPDHKVKPLTHAKNKDHASMQDWVKAVAKHLGLPEVDPKN